MAEPAKTHLIVDAMNVIGSRPNGWWRDRDAAIRGLAGRLQRLAATDQQPITIVIDGHQLADLPTGIHSDLEVLYASRRGPNAADDRIIELIQAHAEPASLELVTSDRDLSQRATVLGARVKGARWLLERLDRLDV